MAQSVEHILGKDEVTSSSLVSSSTTHKKAILCVFYCTFAGTYVLYADPRIYHKPRKTSSFLCVVVIAESDLVRFLLHSRVPNFPTCWNFGVLFRARTFCTLTRPFIISHAKPHPSCALWSSQKSISFFIISICPHNLYSFCHFFSILTVVS